MKQTTLIAAMLLSIALHSQDSLWTETPAIKDAATAAVTVGEEFATIGGRLKAIKFWKNELNGNYTITLWHPNGASLFSQQYRSTTTGWQRITMDLPIDPGTYVVGVYYPNGKYVYTNGMHPRTRGSITGNKGLFAGGNSKPAGSYTASFFVDVVVTTEQPHAMLIVNAGLDTAAVWPCDSIQVKGIASGDSVKYNWTLDNQWGDVALSGLGSLTPVVRFKEPDSGAILILTATDKWGNTSEHGVSVSVMPDFEPYVRRYGELIMNQIRWEMYRKWKAGE